MAGISSVSVATSRQFDIQDMPMPGVSDTSAVDSSDLCHFEEASKQCAADYKAKTKLSTCSNVLARMFGKVLLSRISNVFASLGLGEFYSSRRDYSVLPPSTLLKTQAGSPLVLKDKPCTAEDLAQHFAPCFFTTNQAQSKDPNQCISQLRYEVLPPRSGKDYYAIIYYMGRESEVYPFPLVSRLLNWTRSVFWGTKRDWKTVEIDVDRNTGKANRILFESSNYTDIPESFNQTSPKDLHLYTQMAAVGDQWTYTLTQKDGQSRQVQIEDPFKIDPHVNLSLVSWNASIDLKNRAEQRGCRDFYPMPKKPELSFLDIQTFCQERMDLRLEWMQERKRGRCPLILPARKPKLTLMS